jgi:glycosidase
LTWWREGSIYQVYPRSFQDASGDGAGDLEGIRTRLPYLAWLGVDAVWLSPFYRSPMVDFGYDVSDHEDVDPLFGSLEDWDRLAADARALGLRLILDFVPNHTSEQHPWFASGKRRDWYLWRDEPTNWVSVFGGPAWTWHEAMAGVLRFWVARGADGFRIDALRQTIKDDRWRDNPPNRAWREGEDPYHALLPDEAALPDGAWPNWVLGNHDRPRLASRLGAAQARAAALLLLTLRGTPTLYYGEEIGVCDVPVPAHRVQDPWERRIPGRGLGRDPERAPMQWDGASNAGLCVPGVDPWLPLADDAGAVNVAAQRDDVRAQQRRAHRRHREPSQRQVVGADRRRQSDDGPAMARWRNAAGRVLVGRLGALDGRSRRAPRQAATGRQPPPPRAGGWPRRVRSRLIAAFCPASGPPTVSGGR